MLLGVEIYGHKSGLVFWGGMRFSFIHSEEEKNGCFGVN
jgi:hypothetical protein